MKLEQTADGSYTLYVPELDEHYHSVKGALTESQHIFIEMGLKNPEEGSRPAVPLYDIIYFDAFAPEKQPEMWEQSLFDTLYKVLNEGGILTTYCAKGVVRRMLQTAGFTVERLPGPPGGKREILRATKSD